MEEKGAVINKLEAVKGRLADPFFEQQYLGKSVMLFRSRRPVPAGVTPAATIGEWESGDDMLTIAYQYAATALGEILVGATEKGVCFVGLAAGDKAVALSGLKRRFPGNTTEEKQTAIQQEAIDYLNSPRSGTRVRLHLKGTVFQLSVWRKLLDVPFGGLTTYARLGGNIQNARATGSAVGDNPVYFIVPCHRVIRSDGSFEGYYWGNELKMALLAWERLENEKQYTPEGIEDITQSGAETNTKAG